MLDICCFISRKTFEGLVVDQGNILAITIRWFLQHSSLFIFPAFIIHPPLKLRSCVYIYIHEFSSFLTLINSSREVNSFLERNCHPSVMRKQREFHRPKINWFSLSEFERENTRFLKLWKIIIRRDKENSKFVVLSVRSTRILATVSVEQFYFRQWKKKGSFTLLHRRNVFIALESGAGLRLIRFLGRVKRRSTISAPRKLVNWLSVCGL